MIAMVLAWGVLAAPAAATTIALEPGAEPRAVGLEATGGVWRALLELAPGCRDAGIWVRAGDAAGWRLTLGGGLTLTDAAGQVLWRDPGAPANWYTPYWIEAVVEPSRIRVQQLGWDGTTLQSQSEWIEVPAAAAGELRLVAGTRPARFHRWELAAEPLSPIVADAPNKLRLTTGEGSDWRLTGETEWRWTSIDRVALRPVGAFERTSLINLARGGAEGRWRCRVTVDQGAGGAGLLFACSADAERGFLAWLGGTHGNGALMLYRLPLTALWSAPQGQWKYDTEYLIEAELTADRVRVRQLSADGATEIAASPWLELLPEERGRAGGLGFMSWLGPATFAPETSAPPTAPAASPLGDGWRGAGEWRLDDGRLTGSGTALSLADAGIQARWSTLVRAEAGCQAVGLVFQAAEDAGTGWLCRLGERLTLESLAGRVLWQRDDVALEAGRVYRLEGLVVTDRVQLRLLDQAGAVLAESTQVYVTDTNNTRRGVLGFRAEGGPATFWEWAVR